MKGNLRHHVAIATLVSLLGTRIRLNITTSGLSTDCTHFKKYSGWEIMFYYLNYFWEMSCDVKWCKDICYIYFTLWHIQHESVHTKMCAWKNMSMQKVCTQNVCMQVPHTTRSKNHTPSALHSQIIVCNQRPAWLNIKKLRFLGGVA